MINLAELRKSKNISQKDFAKYLNISQGNLCEWEKGRIEPSIDFMKKIADYFDVSIDYLVGRTDMFNTVIQSNIPALTVIEQEVVNCMRNVTDDGLNMIVENARFILSRYAINDKTAFK